MIVVRAASLLVFQTGKLTQLNCSDDGGKSNSVIKVLRSTNRCGYFKVMKKVRAGKTDLF